MATRQPTSTAAPIRPSGAIITYYLSEGRVDTAPSTPDSTITLRFDDADGDEIKTFKSLRADEEEKAAGTRSDDTPDELRIPANTGWNRFAWDLRYPDAHKVLPHDDGQQGSIKGPVAAPGRYQATLTVGDEVQSASFDVEKEVGVLSSDADLQEQFDLLITIRDKVSATHKVINQMRDVRAQLKGWRERLAGLESASGIIESAKTLEDQVLTVEKELMVPDTRAGWADMINSGVRMAAQLATLSDNVALGDYKPADYEYEAFDEVAADIDGVVEKFEELVDEDMAEFNTMLSNAGFGVVALKVE